MRANSRAAIASAAAIAWGLSGALSLVFAQSTPGLAPTPTPTSSSAGLGAQAPVIAPTPAWVTPVALPALPATNTDAAIRFLLQDQQALFEHGRQTFYTEMALRIETPQGLAAGNISLPWRPETDVLTIHKLQIHRGATVIDVLSSGQTFTVLRREQNLESAVLDGVLTANIQPEGLEVGDVIDMAFSVASSDPVFGDHVELMGAAWSAPLLRAHLSVAWPQDMHINQRVSPNLPNPRLTRRSGMQRFELAMDNVEPVAPPNGAPARYAITRLAEFTSFESWADLAALLAPHYTRASGLPAEGPLAVEVARIRESSSDPVARAEAALALVQNRVRYVALAMGEGGLVPAEAATTWSRRFGDCKAKTALLLAILHALEIEADPVAVSTSFGEAISERLPMIAVFDHVLVRATINGRVYWLDGTRSGDTHLDHIETPNFGWGLPIVAQGAALVRMQPGAPTTPLVDQTVRIDASAGLAAPAPIHAEFIMRGDGAVAANALYAYVSPQDRDRMLREYWRRQFEGLEIASVTASFDADTREERFTMDGRVTMNWSRRRYDITAAGLGYRADFTREAGPNRDAPFAVDFPAYMRFVETIVLPPGQSAFRLVGGDDVDTTIAGVSYRRHAEVSGNTFQVEASARSVAQEFPAAEAPSAQAALLALANRRVYLMQAQNYVATPGDLSTAAGVEPTDAEGFTQRGSLYLNADQYDEAITDFTRALALDPRNLRALADRGMTYTLKGDRASAVRDLDAAAAIEPNDVVVWRARGALAQQAGAPADAIVAYTRVLASAPGDLYALAHRAQAYRSARDDEHALLDANAATAIDPHMAEPYALRANIYIGSGDRTRAGGEGDALAAASPDNAYAQVVIAEIYRAAGRRDDAMHAYDRALAIGPEAYIYLNRAITRPDADVEGRRADIDAALQLDPDMIDALAMRADILERQHDYANAIESLSRALRVSPYNSTLLTRRGVDYALTHRDALADADFTAARAHANAPGELNDMCWTKAVAGVALDSALAECDAALAQTPGDASFLDSRALVLLRLGRLDEAIVAYDQALAGNPNLPTSLYGRSIARARKGDSAGAAADLAAATEMDADIIAQMESYGVSATTH